MMNCFLNMNKSCKIENQSSKKLKPSKKKIMMKINSKKRKMIHDINIQFLFSFNFSQKQNLNFNF